MINTTDDLITFSWLATYPVIWLFLVMYAAWVSSEISVKCVGASHSFPSPSFFHYVLLMSDEHPFCPTLAIAL